MTTTHWIVTTELTARRIVRDAADPTAGYYFSIPSTSYRVAHLPSLAAVRAHLDEAGTRYPGTAPTPDGGLWPSDAGLFRNACGYTDPRTGDLVEAVSIVAAENEGATDPRLIAALHRSLTGRSTPVVRRARQWNPITGLDAPRAATAV